MSICSIIIPNHNKARFIEETLRSVMAQSYTYWEAIVVDDASTDDSCDIVEKLAKEDSRIRLLKVTNVKGAAYPRNHGYSATKGDFVLFLDSDDLLAPDCLAQRLQAFEQHPDSDFLVFPMALFQNNLEHLIRKERPPLSHDYLCLFLSHHLPWSVMQPLWRKASLEGLLINGEGPYDASFPCHDDPELHISALLIGLTGKVIEGAAIDCYYRQDEDRHAVPSQRQIENLINGFVALIVKFGPQIQAGQQDVKKRLRALRGTCLSAICKLNYLYRFGFISQVYYWEQVNRILDESGHMGVLQKRHIMVFKFFCSLRHHNIIFKGDDWLLRQTMRFLR